MKKWFLTLMASGLFTAALANVGITTNWGFHQPSLPKCLRKG